MQLFQVMKRSFTALALCLFLAACSINSNAEADLRSALENLEATQEVQEIRLSLIENLVDQQTAEINSLKKIYSGEAVPQAGSRVPAKPPAAPKAAKPAAPAKQAGPDRQAYDQALAALNSGKNREAEQMFAGFPNRYPQSPLVPNAEYWLGESYYSQGRYSEAILTFQSVAAKFPEHDKAAAALLKMGYSYERLSDTRNARFYLQQLADLYPKSQPAALARTALGRLPKN